MSLPRNTHETRTLQTVFSAFPVAPSSKGRKLITRAFMMADSAHRGQTRASGVPYIQHVLATAEILAGIGMDSRTVAAGLLHDVPEDTDVTLATIEKEFGRDIAHMIEGITKLGKMKLRGDAQDYKLENWRRMFLAMGDDIRTVIIKLADRLHNMRTLEHLRPEKQQRIAHETMEIYVPIANRLGIGEVRSALAENAFKYLDPEKYTDTKRISEDVLTQKGEYLKRAITEMKSLLKEKNIRYFDINGRAKTLHSLHLKLQKHEGDVNRVYDIIAVRVVVPDVASCYEALGVIHRRYRPMVGRIKDYISLPKPNGYQSLHTTIFGPEGQILEIQIRTQQMHDEAEMGIAAHCMEGLRVDFLKNHIFAFTPKGDVIELPEDATIVDFAYAIHTDIGNTAVGARTDGKMAALDSVVKNGQVIEIVVDKNRDKPNTNWLTFVKTSHAKSSIRRQNKSE